MSCSFSNIFLHHYVHKVTAVIWLDVFWNVSCKLCSSRPSLSLSSVRELTSTVCEVMFPHDELQPAASLQVSSSLLTRHLTFDITTMLILTVVINILYDQHLSAQERMTSAGCSLCCTCVSCWTSAPCYMEMQHSVWTCVFSTKYK